MNQNGSVSGISPIEVLTRCSSHHHIGLIARKYDPTFSSSVHV
jgi:hypothetical protein